jgi:hypothetical protein
LENFKGIPITATTLNTLENDVKKDEFLRVTAAVTSALAINGLF